MTTNISAGVAGKAPESVRPTSAGWIRMAVLAGLIVFVYWDVLRGSLIGRWLNDADWSHGWLIPAFSIYFLYTRWPALQRAEVRPSWLGALILAGSLALFFLGAAYAFSYPQAVSVVGAIFGVTLLLGGWGVMRHAWFPICFLLLAVPLPVALYVKLTTPLRELATHVAAAVLPILKPGLYTEAQAVVIDYVLPGSVRGQLNVEEACAGMRLMMAFVTLGVAMAWIKDRPIWQRLVLVAACVPIAVFCNSVRVVATGLLHVNGLEAWARGTPHHLLGLAMLGLALLLYGLLAFVLEHLFVEPEEPVRGEA